MKKADDIIWDELELDGDGWETFWRYEEVVKAIKIAQIDAIDKTAIRGAQLSLINDTEWNQIAHDLKKELDEN